ncbi:uncharacterized protein LOC143024013 [Oratosquilla oratoria]|uniref:uncharacterized protein LOC143024013 n=1 Tax=Oratosquilla oratoria TaxID=337810 RepID=UPI003F771AA1
MQLQQWKWTCKVGAGLVIQPWLYRHSNSKEIKFFAMLSTTDLQAIIYRNITYLLGKLDRKACETVIEVHPEPHPPQEEHLQEHHIQDALTSHTVGPSSQLMTPPEEVGEVYPRPLLPQEEHHYQETCTSPEPKNKKILQFIKRMSFYNKDLHKRLRKVTRERNQYCEEIKKYQEIINTLRNELDNATVECQENVSKALSKTFTENQTQYFVSN